MFNALVRHITLNPFAREAYITYYLLVNDNNRTNVNGRATSGI